MSEIENKVAEWLDANLWDGDGLSLYRTARSDHVAMFNPWELKELVVELIKDINKA